MKNKGLSLAKIRQDPRVDEAWSEEEDGYWVTLKNGWFDFDHDPLQPTDCIHEWTIRDVLDRLKTVRKEK